jgi:hypothetical protein
LVSGTKGRAFESRIAHSITASVLSVFLKYILILKNTIPYAIPLSFPPDPLACLDTWGKGIYVYNPSNNRATVLHFSGMSKNTLHKGKPEGVYDHRHTKRPRLIEHRRVF